MVARRIGQGEKQILYHGCGAPRRMWHSNRRQHCIDVTLFRCRLWTNYNCGKVMDEVPDVWKMMGQQFVARRPLHHC
jgi:hypothetical protein